MYNSRRLCVLAVLCVFVLYAHANPINPIFMYSNYDNSAKPEAPNNPNVPNAKYVYDQSTMYEMDGYPDGFYYTGQGTAIQNSGTSMLCVSQYTFWLRKTNSSMVGYGEDNGIPGWANSKARAVIFDSVKDMFGNTIHSPVWIGTQEIDLPTSTNYEPLQLVLPSCFPIAPTETYILSFDVIQSGNDNLYEMKFVYSGTGTSSTNGVHRGSFTDTYTWNERERDLQVSVVFGAYVAPSVPPPVIFAITPSTVFPGTTVVVTGENFNIKGNFYIGGVRATVWAYTNTSFAATVPNSVSFGVQTAALFTLGMNATSTITVVSPPPPPLDPVMTCGSYGDPHVNPFNGRGYESQLNGEFLFAHVGDVIVQVRQMKCFGGFVHCNFGLAVSYLGELFEFYMINNQMVMRHNNFPTTITDFPIIAGGAMVIMGPNNYHIYFNDTEVLVSFWNILDITVKVHTDGVDSISPIKGGLCGGIQNMKFRDGTELFSVSPAPNPFLESWRLPQNESLFDYTLSSFSYSDIQSESTNGNTKRDDDAPTFDVALAEQTCKPIVENPTCNEMFPSGEYFANCMFDVEASGLIAVGQAAVVAYLKKCQDSFVSRGEPVPIESPMPTVATASTISGSGTKNGAINTNANIEITAINAFGEPQYNAGDNFVIKCTSLNGQYCGINGRAEYTGTTGVWTASFSFPSAPGHYSVDIQLEGLGSVFGSPYTIVVYDPDQMPVIESAQWNTLSAGSIVTIGGYNFLSTKGQVLFGTIPAAQILMWNNDIIVCAAPLAPISFNGELTVVNTAGQTSFGYAVQWSPDTVSVTPPHFHCNAWGNSHVSSFLGRNYDFQAYGEFVLLQHDDVTVQIRQSPCAVGTTCITGVAVNDAGVYSFGASPVVVTGTQRIETNARFYTIYAGASEHVVVKVYPGRENSFTVSVSINSANQPSSTGFCGFDLGLNVEEISTATALTSNRVTPQTSLLLYTPHTTYSRQNPATYQLHKTGIFYDPILAYNARRVCDTIFQQYECQSIVNPGPFFSQCMFDVATRGDSVVGHSSVSAYTQRCVQESPALATTVWHASALDSYVISTPNVVSGAMGQFSLQVVNFGGERQNAASNEFSAQIAYVNDNNVVGQYQEFSQLQVMGGTDLVGFYFVQDAFAGQGNYKVRVLVNGYEVTYSPFTLFITVPTTTPAPVATTTSTTTTTTTEPPTEPTTTTTTTTTEPPTTTTTTTTTEPPTTTTTTTTEPPTTTTTTTTTEPPTTTTTTTTTTEPPTTTTTTTTTEPPTTTTTSTTTTTTTTPPPTTTTSTTTSTTTTTTPPPTTTTSTTTTSTTTTTAAPANWCAVQVEAVKGNSWVSGGTTVTQYTLKVKNTGSPRLLTVKVSLNGPTSISSYWGINLVSGNTWNVELYSGLPSGETQNSAGLQVTGPNNLIVSVVSSTCYPAAPSTVVSTPAPTACSASIGFNLGNPWFNSGVAQQPFTLAIANTGNKKITAIKVAFGSQSTIASYYNIKQVGSTNVWSLDLWNSFNAGATLPTSYGGVAAGNNMVTATIHSLTCEN